MFLSLFLKPTISAFANLIFIELITSSRHPPSYQEKTVEKKLPDSSPPRSQNFVHVILGLVTRWGQTNLWGIILIRSLMDIFYHSISLLSNFSFYLSITFSRKFNITFLFAGTSQLSPSMNIVPLWQTELIDDIWMAFRQTTDYWPSGGESDDKYLVSTFVSHAHLGTVWWHNNRDEKRVCKKQDAALASVV